MGEQAQTGAPLAGRVIAVTRPPGQSAHLADLVRDAGGTPFLFPTLAIERIDPAADAAALLQHLGVFDLAVFVSANAVAHGLPLVLARGGWPPRLRAAAVGAGTAAVLRSHGLTQVLVPVAGADSEALLALPEMREMRGRRVVIFRGEGGRELIADTLRMRGAQVHYVECYRRFRPAVDAEALRDRLRRAELDAVTASSAQAVANLLELTGPELVPQLLTLPLFVAHANIGRAARQLGFRRVQVTPTSDEALLRGMIEYFAPPA